MWLDDSIRVWKAGDTVPAGRYVRIDNRSYRLITLKQQERLPASFDGQIALYRAAADPPRGSQRQTTPQQHPD